jgi:hypothetical protein
MSWKRVNRNRPCVICGKPDWCGYTVDGAARCMRSDETPPGWKCVARDPNGGTTYRPEGEVRYKRSYVPPKPKPKPPKKIQWSRLNEKYLEDFAAQGELDDFITNELGVSKFWTFMFDIGWSSGHSAFTFPMRDAAGNVTGVRLRTKDGAKFAVNGSEDGLFMPHIIEVDPDDYDVLIAEGPSDTMNLWQLGYIAIGRPSCHGGKQQCIDFCEDRNVVIVSDKDSPGRSGARSLSQELLKVSKSVKIIEPLVGKDARDWIESGATKDQIDYVIDQAMEVTDDQEEQIQCKPTGGSKVQR